MRFPTTLKNGQWRPLIPGVVESMEGSRTLVDSGADITVFPILVARQLGIDTASLSKGSVSGAVGGQLEYSRCEVLLELRRFPETVRWKTFVGLVDSPLSHSILGTRGFFEFFRFEYVAGESYFEVAPSAELPS